MSIFELLDYLFPNSEASNELPALGSSHFRPIASYGKDGIAMLTLGQSGSCPGQWVLAEPALLQESRFRCCLTFEPYCVLQLADADQLTPCEVDYVTRKAGEVEARRRARLHPCSECGQVLDPAFVDDNFKGRVVCHGCMTSVHGVVF